MRITQGMLSDQFEKTLEQNYERLSDSFTQISSGKKFTKASQDPLDALKTLRALHDLDTAQTQGANLATAKSWVSNTESTVEVLGSIIQNAQTALTAANNSGSLSDDDRQSYAQTLKSLQGEVLQELNTTFGSRYVFGGSTDGPAPFKVGTAEDGEENAGKLMAYAYNAETPGYVAVESLTGAAQSSFSLSMPVDLGLGIQVGADGKVKDGSAIDLATSGLSVVTYNVTDTGCSDLYDLLGSAAAKLAASAASGTCDLSGELSGIQEAQNSELLATADVGEKEKMIGFLSTKNDTDVTNLETEISSLSDTDISAATVEYFSRQMAYQAALSVGAKIIEPTLIDFLK